MQAQELLTTVLEGPDYGVRARRLRAHKPTFRSTYVDGFLKHAEEALRRDPSQARQCARLGLYVARSLGDERERVRCLRVLSQAALLVGRYPESLRAVDEALGLLRPDGGRRERAELKAIRVQVLTQLERWAEAREVGRRVLELFEQLGDEKGIIRIRLALADLATQLDRPREALRQYRHIEWLLPAQTPPRLRAAIAANRANALQACNRFHAAARWFRAARAIFEGEGCDHTTAQMDYNLAYSAVLRGHFQLALKRYDDVERTFIALGDEMHRAHVDLDRAEVHLLLNLPDDARGYADRAARRFAELGLDRDQAQADYFSARAAALCGELDEAAERYAAARGRFADLGLRSREVGCLVQQAYVWQRLERPGEARRLGREAQGLLDEFANPLSQAAVGLLHANLDLAAGLLEPALRGAQGVLARVRRIHAPWLHIEAQRVAGRAQAALGCAPEAIGAYEAAIDLLERDRGGVPPDEYMTAYLSARAEIYTDLIELLVARGDVERAFEVGELAKSRALFDRLAGRAASPLAEGSLHAGRIQVLRESLNAVYWQLLRAGGGSDEEAAGSRSSAHDRAEALEEELEHLLRRRRLAQTPTPAEALQELPSASALRADLDADTVLLDYVLTRSGLVIFVVSRDAIHAVRTPLEPGEIEERVQRLRFHLAKHERPTLVAKDLVLRATRDNLQQLYGLLLAPVAEHLTGSRLVIAADGRLHGIPFHALPWGEGWLFEHCEVLYAPSASVYGQCAAPRTHATGDPAVFGVPDPELPHIEAEARTVAQLLDTPRLSLGADATLEALRSAAESARMLHVVTHGMFRRTSPMLSAMRLGDGWVSHYDLDSLRVRGELVVLSTCESGIAGVTPGNEILGLARGFLHAGTPALLCSQWRVRDEVAAAFMQTFYGALRDGADAAAAHRAAMAAVHATHAHPYYWAPFFLMGAPTAAAGRIPSVCREGPSR